MFGFDFHYIFDRKLNLDRGGLEHCTNW